jgi:hypothetical protein
LEFEATVAQLNSWMDYMEGALSVRSTSEQGTFDGLSMEEQLQTYKDMETDVDHHKIDVDRVVALGKHLVEEAQSGKFTCLLVECYLWRVLTVLKG